MLSFFWYHPSMIDYFCKGRFYPNFLRNSQPNVNTMPREKKATNFVLVFCANHIKMSAFSLQELRCTSLFARVFWRFRSHSSGPFPLFFVKNAPPVLQPTELGDSFDSHCQEIRSICPSVRQYLPRGPFDQDRVCPEVLQAGASEVSRTGC